MEQAEIVARIAAILAIIKLPDHLSPAERRARAERLRQQRYVVSETYGQRRGWQWIERFPLCELARLSVVGELWDPDLTDHHSFWTFQGRPTTVAAHLYNCDQEKREAVHLWANRHGLQVSFPLDFPSWWYPGRTTLVEFMRAS